MAQQQRAGDALGAGKAQPGDTEHTNDTGLFNELGDAIIDGENTHAPTPPRANAGAAAQPTAQPPMPDTPDIKALNTSMPDNVQGMHELSGTNTTTGRGTNSTVGGAVGGGTQGGGIGGTTSTSLTGNLGNLVGNDVDGAAQGIGRRSDTTPVAGGVAENAGRGSDLGDVEHTASDLADGMEGISSGTTGGTRSGQDKDVRGAVGGGKDEDSLSK